MAFVGPFQAASLKVPHEPSLALGTACAQIFKEEWGVVERKRILSCRCSVSTTVLPSAFSLLPGSRLHICFAESFDPSAALQT